jgi:hypothetical protein
MRLAGRTMIPASLMLRSGSVLSGTHAGAAPADGTDLPAMPICGVNCKSVLRTRASLESQWVIKIENNLVTDGSDDQCRLSNMNHTQTYARGLVARVDWAGLGRHVS